MNPPPFAVLKLSMILVMVSLLLAGSGGLWSWLQVKNADHALQQQESKLKDARQTLQNSRQQQHLIAAHLAEYQALVARGFVGPEKRLVWIESVHHANRDASLYGLNYRLTPRTASPPQLAEGLALGQTTMTLTLPLLVETDLSRFLDALKARASGMVHVQGCRLSHPANTEFEPVNQPRLEAECTLQWFTIEEKTRENS